MKPVQERGKAPTRSSAYITDRLDMLVDAVDGQDLRRLVERVGRWTGGRGWATKPRPLGELDHARVGDAHY
jgi:hypothetical protein